MKNKTATKITIWLMFFTMIGRATGLFREMMLSYVYGASAMSDAYVVATTFSSIIFAGIAAAILNGYIPIAVEEHKNGNLSNYTNNMMVVTFLVTYIFSFVLFICLNPILSVMAKGFSKTAYNYAYRLSLYILVFAPILCLVNVLVGYLQVRGDFGTSALQSVVTNIIMIVIFYVTINNVDALGIGYGISILIPFVIILCVAHKKNYCLFSKVKRHYSVIKTWMLIIPTLGVQLAAQFNSIIDRSFASTLEEGTVSSLKYAFLICTMAVSIIAVSIGMVQYPKLSLAFSEKKDEEAVNIFTYTMNNVLFVVTPIVFCTIFLAVPIIRILFQHGAFLQEDTDRTAVLLQVYAFAMLGNSFQEIISRILLAAKKAKALFVLYIGYVALNIIFNIFFVKLWGACGLAFGTTLSTLISVVVMLGYLKWAYRCFRFKDLGIPFIKTLISSVCMILTLSGIKVLIANMCTNENSIFIMSLLYLLLCICVGATVYFIVLLILKEKMALNLRKRIGQIVKGKKYEN